MKLTLDNDTLRLISLFEKITRARVKDCFEYKGKLTFIVEQGELGKALGKNKSNLVKIEKLLNRKVKIVSYHPDKLRFITNLLAPLKVLEIKEEEPGIITIKGPDAKTKGLMIGAKAQNLRATEEIVRKYFDCKEIKVI